MNRCRFFAIAFVALAYLTACTPVNQTTQITPIVRQISPQEAGQIIFDATTTAQVLATQNAVSTETRRQTQQANDDGYTATAVAQSVRATDSAATGAALSHTATATAQIAVAAAAEQQGAATAEERRQWGETTRFALSAFLIALIVIVVIVGGVIAVALREQMANERGRQTALAEVELMRLKLAAFAAAIRETRAGTVLPMLEGPPLVLARPADGLRVAHSKDELDDLLNEETQAEEAPPADPITINSNGGSHTVSRVTTAEKEAYGRMLHFLHLAAMAHAKANRRGWDENTLPGWRDIGLNSASEWTAYANLFGGAIERKPGKGTFCGANYPTLRELRAAVRFGKIRAVLRAEQAVP